MKRYASELIFISRISADGESVSLNVENNLTEYERKEIYKLRPLSISKKTWIASSMSTYVVKLKNDPK
jgi:hypothetical protein